MNDEARFCSACGTPMQAADTQPNAQTYTRTYAPAPAYTVSGYGTSGTRLVRPRAGRMLAGVCQGLANNYAWDVVWVRVITVLLAIFGGGIGLVGYVVFWIVMPEEPMALPAPSYTPPMS